MARKSLNELLLNHPRVRTKFKAEAMPRENYGRILRYYEPREPAALPEKAFYVCWAVMCVVRILVTGAKIRAVRKIEMRGA